MFGIFPYFSAVSTEHGFFIPQYYYISLLWAAAGCYGCDSRFTILIWRNGSYPSNAVSSCMACMVN